MSDLKSFIVEKIIMVGTILLVVPTSKYKREHSDSLNPKIYYQAPVVTIKRPVIDTNRVNIDSIDTEKIIKEAREVIATYNNVTREKEKITKEELELAKKEVKNAKTINKLIQGIIDRHKLRTKEDLLVNSIKKDSICLHSVKYLLKKSRVCTDWQIDYYVEKDNKRIVLESFKNKR